MGKEKTRRKVITFRAESLDLEALETIKAHYGLASDNQTLSFSLRALARYIQKGAAFPPTP